MNQTRNYDFTIIVPFFNEKDNVPELERQLGQYVEAKGTLTKCVLFVNDGSNDGGGEAVKDICKRHEDFFYIELDHNCGKSGALRFGIDNCHSKYLGYIDADLQTHPEDFDILLEHIAEYSMVGGARKKRNDSFSRRMQSKIANSYRRMMTKDGATDTGCPLKVLHTDIAKQLPMFEGMHRFIPALVLMVGGNYKEIPIPHYPRTAGVAKYNLWNRLTGPFIDCFGYRWMRKRYKVNSVSHTNLIDEQ